MSYIVLLAPEFKKKCTISVCGTIEVTACVLVVPCSGSKESMKSRFGCKGMSPGWIMSALPA